MRLEFRSVNAAARAAVVDRIMQVEHFVIHDVFERKPRSTRIVEDAADHDHVMGGVEVAEASP